MPEPVSRATRRNRTARLQRAETELTKAVIRHAHRSEEEFFYPPGDEPGVLCRETGKYLPGTIPYQLDEMCAAIAEALDVDTCALFTVTDHRSEADRCIRMRGASGNFVDTLREGRKCMHSKGFEYTSRLPDLSDAMDTQQKLLRMREWPVTNQIWHRGEGRLANSNEAMDLLARTRHKQRVGAADNRNYPNSGTLRTVFRNMIAIPIFARGGATPVVEVDEDEGGHGSDSLARQHRNEFLSQYRVIGILKLEGKRPKRRAGQLPPVEELIERCPPGSQQRLKQWCEKKRNQGSQEGNQLELDDYIVDQLLALFDAGFTKQDEDGFELLNLPGPGPVGKPSGIEARKQAGWRPDSTLIDYLAERFDARFTQDDVELLVSLAMQLGRILSRRTIEHAAAQGIAVSENELGALSILHRDVQDMKALFRFSDRLRQRVEHFFNLLRMELEDERQREIYRTQVSHKVEPRKPIRDVVSRLKDPISLFRKLTNKQDELERQAKAKRLVLHGMNLEMEHFGSLTEQQACMRGESRLFVSSPEHGNAEAVVRAQLGAAGGPQAVATDTPPFAELRDIDRGTHRDRPLVWRVLNVYQVDDIAGVRVTCDYLSDLEHVLDRIRAHVEGSQWRFSIVKIDPALEVAKEGGYRGVHITLKAKVEDLLAPEDLSGTGATSIQDDRNRLREALWLHDDQPLELPCEIQLRTTLQESEASKSHDLTYKHEEEVEKPLLELLKILSNQLHEADRSADIIRDRVEAAILPEDYGERTVLTWLRPPRLTRDGFAFLELALHCAKIIHQRNLRLNGQPYMSHILATCKRLLHNFGVTDPDMLFLVFLHDLWLHPCDHVKKRLQEDNADYNWQGFCQDLDDQMRCENGQGLESVLKHFGSRVRWAERRPRIWFLVLLRSYRLFWQKFHASHHRASDDLAEHQRDRLHELRSDLKQESDKYGAEEDFDEWLQRAFVLEAAILLGELEELPDEPNRERAEQQFRNAYDEFEIIANNLPPSPMKRQVVEETTKVFRQTAEELGVEVPINWYR